MIDFKLLLKRIAAYLITAITYGFVAGVFYSLFVGGLGVAIANLISIVVFFALIYRYKEFGKKVMKLDLVDESGASVTGVNYLKSSTIAQLYFINMTIATLVKYNPSLEALYFIPTIYLLLLILNREFWHTAFGYKVVDIQK